MFKAVVFAYSEVGVRCLQALIGHKVDIPLVVTHEDAKGETAWFGSVANLAAQHAIAVAKPADPNAPAFIERVCQIAPDYILAFYYRLLLSDALRGCARWGALNMHGSLLPRYRGRACINWAILNGETETGVTLHSMVAKPDAGGIIAQRKVPIGIDDTALTVSHAVAAAAARLLVDILPALCAGPPSERPMNLAAGSYFGARTPEDGRIDFLAGAAQIHALIRAVAPPFPGAFTDLASERLVFAGSRWRAQKCAHPRLAPCLYGEGERLYLDCTDGLRLEVTGLIANGETLDTEAFRRRYGEAPLPLSTPALRKRQL